MSRTSPFFIPQKEIDLIDSMNEELIDEIVGQSVDIYKVSVDDTDENIYGESTTKYYEVGFRVNCLINFEEPEIDDKSKEEESEIKFNRNLLRKVDELELSVRSANCLRNDNIVYIGDLVQKSENDMLRTPNFGRKSLNEIREVLMQMGLNLGMDISDWPPENIEELSKNLDDNL